MARPASSNQPIPSSSSTTATITIGTSETSSDHQQPQIRDALVLKLKRPKKKVSWKEGTVDNEFMNKKSSKKCCIYHKEKPFDEDDSDAEDGCVHDHDHDHGGESSKHGDEDNGSC